MPLGILNNIPSLQAENELTLTSTALNSTLEQLASGSRINSGADDPAGLAIANGLQANISALTQSVSNANDGVGELQLADGALAQVTNLLNTAVTLATESATGTVSNSQRTAIQAQYASILAEINQIGTATTYNGQSVFQSGTSTNVNAADNPASAGTLSLNNVLTVGDATTVTAGGTSFTYTAAATSGQNLNEVTGSIGALSPNTVLTATDVVTSTRSTGTSIYTASAGATVGQLLTAINTGVSTADVAVTGTDASHTGYQAVLNPAGKLQITDLNNGDDLGVVETVEAVVGTFTATAAATSTVQNLINAINSSADTVGAQAALVNGVLQITDPLGRGDIAVTTNDAVLGAPVSGTSAAFTNPTTTAAATTNTNELAGNAGTTGVPITAATALTANDVTQFTAGGKTFTFTANVANGETVGALIAAINNPNDAAGLHAYLGTAGSGTTTQLIVTDPNGNNDIAVGAGNTETALGTYTNPSTTGSTTTNIFLSDSTAIGSAQIAVTIGGLSTAAITNGSGASAVNLATTDLSTQTDAQTALTLLNAAISNVASVRGTLGASVNRLTAASNVINSQVQNLTSAENTITAADIPTVVANLTKYSILEQTGISALAQANQQQQLVLKLLQ
jgi:flagellin